MNEVSSAMVVLAFFIGILILLILITIHELGHLIVAKIAKAYVYEFSIGFGPRIFVIKRKETWISFRAFPLGGYCSIASDKCDPPKGREDEEVPNERKLDYIARWKKMFFIFAGPFMNLLVALFLFTTIFASTGVKKNDMTYFGANYNQNMVAAKAIKEKENENKKENEKINFVDQSYVIWAWKLKENENLIFDNIKDEAKKINDLTNQKAVDYKKTVYNFVENLKLTENKTNLQIQFVYKKVDRFSGIALENYQNAIYTNWIEINANEKVGIGPPNRIYKNRWIAYTQGWKETFVSAFSILSALGKAITGKFSELVGPVGVAKQTAGLLNSADQFFLYVGSISANLFVLNLIFIPPLDGYRLLENFAEMIIRRELSSKYKIWVNVIGASLFLLLFIIITVKDFIV